MAQSLLDQSAIADLRNIAAFIGIEQLGPDTARKVAARINRESLRYARQPLMGESRDDLYPELRQFTVPPYVVFYVPSEDGVRILRVVHGARDYTELFD